MYGRKATLLGFEPTSCRNGALSHRLRPLGQSVLLFLPLVHEGLRFACEAQRRWYNRAEQNSAPREARTPDLEVNSLTL